MAMSRKDFVAIASELKSIRPVVQDEHDKWKWLGWNEAVKATARAMGESNARFDLERFFEACGAYGGYPTA